MRIFGLAADGHNPFSAETAELVAAVLEEAGLLRPSSSINGRPASSFLDSYRLKREKYQEVTRLGSLLVRRGVLSEEDLKKALSLHRESGSIRLGDALVRLEICSEDDIRKNIEAQGMIRDSLVELDEFRRKIDSIKERLRLYL